MIARDATTMTDGPAAQSSSERTRPDMFDVLRWAVAALWVFVMVAAVTLGSRGSDFAALDTGLRNGSITAVEVSPGIAQGVEGSALQRVYWRDGVLRHHADVLMEFPGPEDGGEWQGGDLPTWVGHDIAEQLTAERPGLVVTRVPERLSGGGAYGFDVPTWVASLAVLGAVLALTVLVSGPEPWRATRWAWFWLLFTVIGPPLFLLLSGRTWLIPAPRPGHRRLRGFWGLLLSLVLGSYLLNTV